MLFDGKVVNPLSLLRSLHKNVNGRTVAEAELKARQNAAEQKKALLFRAYPDTIISAFILGQAMARPPENEAEASQCVTALTHLNAMAKQGLIPPQLLSPIASMMKSIEAAVKEAEEAEGADKSPVDQSPPGPSRDASAGGNTPPGASQ